MSARDEKDNQEAIQELVELLLEFSLRLIGQRGEKIPQGSGFFWKRSDAIFLVSGGHVVSTGNWLIETNVVDHHHKTVLNLGVGDVHISGSSGRKDFGWAEMDFRRIYENLQKESPQDAKALTIPVYQEPLDRRPESASVYCFAKFNGNEYHPGLRGIVRDPIHETFMTFDGIEGKNGLYRFRLNGKHKAHDVYEGCSGAPIADQTGRIVSMVQGSPEEAGSQPEQNIIWGIPLADLESSIGVR